MCFTHLENLGFTHLENLVFTHLENLVFTHLATPCHTHLENLIWRTWVAHIKRTSVTKAAVMSDEPPGNLDN